LLNRFLARDRTRDSWRSWGRSSIGQRCRTHRRQILREKKLVTNQRLCQSAGL